MGRGTPQGIARSFARSARRPVRPSVEESGRTEATSSGCSRRYSEVTDARSGEDESRGIDQGNLCISRLLLSSFAVLLLCMSSLSAVNLALAAGDYFHVPEVSAVVHEALKLLNRTRELRDEYVECVEIELQASRLE